ncbi:hypothetical protein C5E06_02870 [Pseudoclavibacter sp. RFBI5]|uniref:endonuclease domain-containing protein n=1 Tax=Pseudoclavibacter sp. RFBI5 TaxID=2080578 RepID=UPI000CE79803|nr:DUF559 domain-containing protein [Pseudoclavibacter sp. RFBI5]PPG05303.1 hypothetical protein C5E06_02870 [Pseudoclavibacter sp. RFBI5]
MALTVPRKRLEASDLVATHHGVRVSARTLAPRDLDLSFVRACLGPGQVLAEASGARCWGLPLPWKLIRGYRLDSKRFVLAGPSGIPSLAPATLLAQLAPRLTLTQAVVFADTLRTSFEHYPGRTRLFAMHTLEELTMTARQWKGRLGAATLRSALELSRSGSEFPKETQLRLLIIGGGFSEPVMQHRLVVPGHGQARLDLADVREKIAIEFEGEGHFTDAASARMDLARTEALQRAGWRVIRVTEADLKSPRRLLESIRLALAERGLRP